MKKVVLTGDRPTGNLHLGHLIGSLQSRVKLQHIYDQYIMIADVQALTDYFGNPQKVISNVLEVVADYIAVGVDPQLTTIFIQSQIPALPELTAYYMNLVSVSRLERNPTVKAEISQKEFGESVPAGFLCYPISQAADITAFKAEVIPVGEDQLPMIELSNEIVRRFNRVYNTDCLKESQAYLSGVGRLIGTDGKAKASKSLNNAIFLSDSPEVIKEKVYSMFTDPDHLKVSDPGKVEGNVVFSYLDAFFEEKDEISSLKEQYRCGGLGDTVLKSLLNDVLQKKLRPIREKRESLSKNDLIEICFDGTKKAKSVAQKTLVEVKKAIGINFFGEKSDNFVIF
ncbi:MAG: tryptophan--tRNA ligase [Holosporaceae bacterium]|jgi:tryptophanyl-tRNA synthetase|nr:tryptophan--tRNA ligase [Holosporaceae bacterium]